MKITIVSLAVALQIAAAGLIYPQAMQIVDVDHIADVVTMVTSAGHVYEMTGAEDWQPGDIAAVLFWSCGTASITDDVILSARYSGFASESLRP